MKQFHRAIELLETGWIGSRVVVIGDVMLDRYIRGDVERISPEAPVPVVRVFQETHAAGGAANVAMNIAGLGAHVTLIGCVGDDDNRKALEQVLQDKFLDCKLTCVPGTTTTSKVRVMSGRHQLLRLDFENPPFVDQKALTEMTNEGLLALEGAQAVILSDYGKGALSPEVCQTIISACRSRNIPVLVDPKGHNFQKYSGATTICPNRKELSVVTARFELDELLKAAQDLVVRLQLEYLIVTLSEKGIAIVRQDSIEMSPAVSKQVFDVSGAGDTVIATLALAIASGLSTNTAVALANIAAGVVVSKVGTMPILKHEIVAALAEDISIHKEEKILELDRLLDRVSEWRASGNTIVLTNGCFDVLHIGHVTLLEQARRQGSKLIVAVNDDASVQRLKGPTRPIVGERERSQVLAALAAVDAVVLFSESTPLSLVNAIRPDVLVKGGDYTTESIVGANEVISWGGRVSIVPVVEGFSTTRLIQRATTVESGG